MVELTVIIPTRNRDKVLSYCLTALEKQTYPLKKFKVIVVDDGGVGRTEKIINTFQSQKKIQLKYLKQEHRGPATARNLGIKNAKSKYLLFIGDDIIATPDLLTQHLKFHSVYTNTAVLGKIEWHPSIKITPFKKFIHEKGLQFAFENIKHNQKIPFNYFYTSNISLEKKWFNGDLFDENFPFAAWEDIELGYRLTKKGLKIRYNKNAKAFHLHDIDFNSFCSRQTIVGKSGKIFSEKYPKMPEIQKLVCPIKSKPNPFSSIKICFMKQIINFLDLRDVSFKDKTFNKILLYYYLKGFFS